MRKFLLIALVASTALTGVANAKSFNATPSVALPGAYAHQTEAASAQNQGDWWTAFGDAGLNRLVAQVLVQNNDLAAATIKVRKAQLQAGLAADALRPQVSGGVDGTATRSDGKTTHDYSASLSASYEVDLWGKLGAERDAARWEAKATAEDLDSTALTLAGTTVELYYQLAYLNESIARADASLAYATQVQTLVEKQHQVGQVSGIEAAEAEQNVQTQAANRADLVQQRVETRSALALLLGGATWSETDEPQALPSVALPEVTAGAPAELLSRRPDLRAAELRLRSSLSTVDATRASLYPSISLTGTVGGSSTALSSLLANPVSLLGVGITLPFLNWNQGQLNLKVSKADYEIAVVNFRQTLLQAFVDVDNALSAHTQLAAQGDSLDRSLAAAVRADQLYGVRYRVGAIPLRTWLDAQESRRNAEVEQSQNRLEQINNQVALYQALGGGLDG